MDSIESKILMEYPELVLNKDLPVVVTDDMQHVGGYIPAQALFKTIVSELMIDSVIDLFKPELETDTFFRTDSISRITSSGTARKDMASRIGHCFTLTYWGDISLADTRAMLDDIVFAIEEKEVPTDRGICLLRTAIGDNYILTQGVSIEPAFPTKYYMQLSRLGYDVFYLDSEKEQLETLKRISEARNEEVLKSTSH